MLSIPNDLRTVAAHLMSMWSRDAQRHGSVEIHQSSQLHLDTFLRVDAEGSTLGY